MRRFALVLTAAAALLVTPAAQAGPQDFARLQAFAEPPVPGFSPPAFELVGGSSDLGAGSLDTGAVAKVSESGQLLGEVLLDPTPTADGVEEIVDSENDFYVIVTSEDGNFEVYSLNGDLSLDPQCDQDGEAVIDLGGIEHALAAAGYRGKVYVVGQKDGQGFVARLNHDCTVDRSFNGTGFKLFDLDPAAADQFTTIEIDAAGNLILGGRAGDQAVIVEANSSGALVPGFGSGGVVRIDASPDSDGINGLAVDSRGIKFAGFAGQDSLYGFRSPTGAFSNEYGPFHVADYGGVDFLNGVVSERDYFVAVGTSILEGRPRGVVTLYDAVAGERLSGFNGGNPLIVDDVRTGFNGALAARDGSAFAVGFRDNPLTQSFDFVKSHVTGTGLVNFGASPFALFDFTGAAAPSPGAAEDQTPSELGKRLRSTSFHNNAYEAGFGGFSEPTRVVVVPSVIGDEGRSSAKKTKQKVFVLAAKDYVAKPGKKKTLKFTLGKAAKKYLKTERGKKVTVKLSITTVDVIGNTKTFNRTKHVRIPKRLHF